jgi:hypothetical protein
MRSTRKASHNRNIPCLKPAATGKATSVKRLLNPVIESAARRIFAVDQYADMFEKMALMQHGRPLLRQLFRRHLPQDIAAARLLFIHVPKNGGTSVKRALYASDPGHATLRYYELFLPDTLREKETLAILRDPVERFLSGFDFLMAGGGGDVRIRPEPLKRMAGIGSFDALLDFLEGAKGDWLGVDTFLRPQSWYVTDAAGRLGVQHLWLLEETAAMGKFLTGFGVAAIPHSNRTRRQNRIVSPQQKTRLERLYPEDFELYARIRAEGGYSASLLGAPIRALMAASTSASTAS